MNFNLHRILPLSTVTPIKIPSETHVFYSYVQNTQRRILKFKIDGFGKKTNFSEKAAKNRLPP